MPLEMFVKDTFNYKFDVSELKEFVRQAEENGLNEVTWSAFQGDQREPSQLTLTAKAAR